MASVAGLVLPFFGLIFLGYLAARLSNQPIEALGWMNTFILYLALPALFFQLLSKTPIEELAEFSFIVGSVSATFIIFCVMFVGSLASRSNVPDSTIKGLAAAYGNIGYMGPGLALLAFGPQAAVPVALIFCFENVLHFVAAPTLMAIGGNSGEKGGALVTSIARRIVFHPFIIATVAGVAAAAFHLSVPMPVERLLAFLSAAAAPCALFAMGVTLALRPLKRMPPAIAPIAVLKLVVHPALCYVILSAVGDFSAPWIFSAVLLASLPTATNVFVIAQQYGVWIERASASVLVTTLLSVLTVTGLLYAMTSGLLPPDLFP